MNRTFLKTQMELSEALMEVIDSYYKGVVGEAESMNQIREMCEKNSDLLYSDGQYGTIIQHKLGKKRMRVLNGALL